MNDPLRSLGFMVRMSGSRLKVDAMIQHAPELLKWSLGFRDLGLGSRIFGVQGSPACAAAFWVLQSSPKPLTLNPDLLVQLLHRLANLRSDSEENRIRRPLLLLFIP